MCFENGGQESPLILTIMYGLVNRSIEELVISRFGAPTWEQIRVAAGVTDEVFLSNETYPDAMTYQLVGTASRILGMSAEQILEAFGEHWVLHTAQESYGAMLDLGGRSLIDFLRYLPHLHARVQLHFPDLKPPVFMVTDVGEGAATVHHRTAREGLAPFVVGLLKGLGKRFSTPVSVTQVGWRAHTGDTDSFRVEWANNVAVS